MNLSKLEQAEKLLGVGRFEVSSLIQKRIHELVRGAPPLVNTRSDDPIEIALDEILQGRITLVRGADEPSLGDEGFSLGEKGETEAETINSL